MGCTQGWLQVSIHPVIRVFRPNLIRVSDHVRVEDFETEGHPGLRDLQCGKTRLHTSVSHLLKHISVKRIKIVIVFAVIVLVKVIVVPGEKLNFKVFVFNERNKNFN